jgi:phage terminase small subunit
VEKPFKLAEFKIEPRVAKKKKAVEVVKPKVKKVEPVVPKENVTKSLVSQLSTQTISIAQQKPNATNKAENMTAKVDKVFSDAEKLPEHSHDGIPS